ncbi:MAG TPA: phosphatase PAP2-related protein [Tepidisphaeraceae bacterium]|jgi:hypothetical protein|nr:phosphatase PAP2-related protein [Tepidisphaeraceae bacterium]
MTLPPTSIIAIRSALVIGGIALWYATQSLLAKRTPKVAHELPLTDGIHVLTASLHHRYATNTRAGNRLLISSSLIIDLLGIYLIGFALLGPTIRPYLGLVLLFSLRQICQLLCPLPAPAGMVWRYPGVPAILVTYGTANDLFFSGHTAIAVYAAATLASHHGPYALALGLLIATFEATTVLILRAHYTMDVFTGIITALYVFSIDASLAHRLDTLILHWTLHW